MVYIKFARRFIKWAWHLPYILNFENHISGALWKQEFWNFVGAHKIWIWEVVIKMGGIGKEGVAPPIHCKFISYIYSTIKARDLNLCTSSLVVYLRSRTKNGRETVRGRGTSHRKIISRELWKPQSWNLVWAHEWCVWEVFPKMGLITQVGVAPPIYSKFLTSYFYSTIEARDLNLCTS